MEIATADTSLALMKAAQQRAQKAETMASSAQNAGARNMKQIEAAAKEFEAVFVTEMLKPMFSGLKPDPMFGGGKGEEIFQGFMLQEYGKNIAEHHSIGIADHVKAEMIRLQEETNR